MRVEDFMTREVITVAPDTSILTAAQLMLEHKISGLPVVDVGGHVIGIVSEHDLLRRCEDAKGVERPHWLQLMIEQTRLTDESGRFRDRKVNEVMTTNPVTISPTAPLNEASRLIEDRGIKRLPVLQNGELVGIIARADLVRALAHLVEKAAAATKRDVSVDAHLVELERQIWRSRVRSSKPF